MARTNDELEMLIKSVAKTSMINSENIALLLSQNRHQTVRLGEVVETVNTLSSTVNTLSSTVGSLSTIFDGAANQMLTLIQGQEKLNQSNLLLSQIVLDHEKRLNT